MRGSSVEVAVKRSHLTMVDLAGSERVSNSGSKVVVRAGDDSCHALCPRLHVLQRYCMHECAAKRYPGDG